MIITKKDFLSLDDLSAYEFSELMSLIAKVKAKPQSYRKGLQNRILAMIFQGPSLRTRMAFEVGVLQLGGNAIFINPSDIQIGTRESITDIGKNLERWVDGIMLQTHEHQTVVDLASSTGIPVINARTDLHRPCQTASDFFTLLERKEHLAGLSLAWVGDGGGVCGNLILAASKCGCHLSVATPPGYEPDPEIVTRAHKQGEETEAEFSFSHDAAAAVREADVVYTDSWPSSGKEADREALRKNFAPYRVDGDLMAKAKPDALFMHGLPARRGEEVADEVIDSKQSIVYDQAENRLHIQKAIMLLLLGNRK